MKSLSGAEVATYMKANQAHTVKALRSRKIHPKLVIIRDSDNPVIGKYVALKKQYGEDIGVEVEDWLRQDIPTAIAEANSRSDVHGVIVQLPLAGEYDLDTLLPSISPAKDVDGLGTEQRLVSNPNAPKSEPLLFDSATATAINWLVASYDLDLAALRIALVGYGRLIGKPLARMWSVYQPRIFRHADDLSALQNYDLIVTATGAPRVIKNEFIKSGAYLIDAGTASEGGILVGDVDDAVRDRSDLAGITPKVGGVGPLTVTALFEHVLIAASRSGRCTSGY